MQKITVNLEDSEMALLKAIAQDVHVDPMDVINDHIKELMATLDAQKRLLDCATAESHTIVESQAALMDQLNLLCKPCVVSSNGIAHFASPSIVHYGILGHSFVVQAMGKAKAAFVLGWFESLYRAHSTASEVEYFGIPKDHAQTDTLAARRAARRAALKHSQGIWSGEPGKPKDGVQYQEGMRAEWQ
jgi:hypothetical protein